MGTKFWKEFRFNDRKIETRFLWRASLTRWVARSYVWNDDGTEAVLAAEEGLPGVAELAPGKRHTHSVGERLPRLPRRAPHRPARVQRAAALDRSRPERDSRRAAGARHDHASHAREGAAAFAGGCEPRSRHPPRIATENPATRAVLGYFAANCGSCHNGSGEIATLGPSLKHSDLLADGDAVARALMGHPTHWQAPGSPKGRPFCSTRRRPKRARCSCACVRAVRPHRCRRSVPSFVIRSQSRPIRRWIDGQVSSTRAFGAIPR